MIKPSKKLVKFIEMYPTQKEFASAFKLEEATVSRMLKERRDVPESVILAIQDRLSWALGDIIEIVEDKDGHD